MIILGSYARDCCLGSDCTEELVYSSWYLCFLLVIVLPFLLVVLSVHSCVFVRDIISRVHNASYIYAK